MFAPTRPVTPRVRTALVVHAGVRCGIGQIADRVTDGLVRRHLEARVASALDDPDPTGVDVVIIGSAVRDRSRLSEAEDYLTRHCTQLCTVDTWLFTVAPTLGLFTDPDHPAPQRTSDRVVDIIRRIHPLGNEQFTGDLDTSTFERNRSMRYDGRHLMGDEDRIDAWAGTIATHAMATHQATPYTM